MSSTLTSDAETHQAGTVARSQLYARLAELFTFPTEEMGAACRSGELETELRDLVGALPYRLPVDGAAFDASELSYVELQSEFIRLFEVASPGGGSPPCSLYGGMYASNRRQVMEEVLRFYRHFGLRLNPDIHDLPDSIPTVLEFLHFLTYREGTPGEGGDEVTVALRNAQRDLLSRHLTQWTPQMAQRLAALDAMPLYRAALDLLHAFAAAELSQLAGAPVTS